MYKKQKHIHFIGIGGIGMSGIAEILCLQGHRISGCDTGTGSKILNHLEKIGCSLNHSHSVDHIETADILVYSSAITPTNPELLAALKKGIPVIPRGIMLAELMRTKYGIVIAGAHGKTTTTSMIAHVLIEAHLDPTVIVGGILKNLSSHIKLGKSSWMIAESDESDRSFLYLNPTIAVVTNIDNEHLDTYKTLDGVKQAFKHFLERLPFYGKAILCGDDENIQSILPLPHIPIIKYGLHSDADIQGTIISLRKDGAEFEVRAAKNLLKDHLLPEEASCHDDRVTLGTINLHLLGKHNVLNALAAISLCIELDIPFAAIKKALESFQGIERRFEYKGAARGADIFDDYGHHPTEIYHTLLIAQQRANKRLHVIFQPHRFSRLSQLWDDFVQLFTSFDIDTLYITDIYAASEQPVENITSKRLAHEIEQHLAQYHKTTKVIYTPSTSRLAQDVYQTLAPGDLVITLGAGKINKIGEEIVEHGR